MSSMIKQKMAISIEKKIVSYGLKFSVICSWTVVGNWTVEIGVGNTVAMFVMLQLKHVSHLNLKFFFFKYEMGHVTGVQNIAFFFFLNIL